MEKIEKIVLKDGTEIEIENGAVENCIQVKLPDLDRFKDLYEKFSESNLESYKIQNAEGLTCATYENKYMKNALVEQTKDNIHVAFNLADVDMVSKRLDALEAGKELQDGAIADLGDVVSTIAEGGEYRSNPAQSIRILGKHGRWKMCQSYGKKMYRRHYRIKRGEKEYERTNLRRNWNDRELYIFFVRRLGCWYKNTDIIYGN